MKIKFYLICTFLCVTCSIKVKSQHFLDSAKHYENQQQFVKASVFYERILFEPVNQNEVDIAIINKIECLKKQGLFLQASRFIKSNLQLIGSDSFRYKIYEQWILCSYLTNHFEEGLSIIEQAKSYFPNNVNADWLNFFKILFLNEQNNWNAAKIAYKEWLLQKNRDTTSLTIYNNLPHLKSEKKAKWLATLLPGTGMLYANNFPEAVASVLLQGLGLYYGYISLEAKYYLSTWLVGLGVYGSFYLGGVRRTETLVKNYNKKLSSKFNDKLKDCIKKTLHLQSFFYYW
jgi:tetratricopeptide (TPR) repeat protein